MGSFANKTIEHPGVFIQEEIEERGWSQRDLAYILGRSEQAVNMIISGKRGISADMARNLEMAFDVPAEFFLNLQKMYDLSCSHEPDAGVAKRASFYNGSYPIREMIRRGWLEDTEPHLLEAQMMRFFCVDRPEAIPRLAHRAKKTHYDIVPPDQLAWLFRVRHIAKSISIPSYSEKKLIAAKEALRSFMLEPEEIRHIPRLLMECGVRFIVVEALPNSKIDGVCFWLDNKSPVIGMSTLKDRIDNLWFVLVHEIEHVLQKHGRVTEIIDTDLLEKEDIVSIDEVTANNASADFCTPRDRMKSFIARKYPYISERDILGLASGLGVHPGVVIGQLHNVTKDYRYFRKYLVKTRQYLLPTAIVDGWGHIAPVNL